MKILLGTVPVFCKVGNSNSIVTDSFDLWQGDADGAYTEMFLDLDHSSIVGPTVSVNRPVKDDDNNPLLVVAGTNSDTWDYQKTFVAVRYEEPTFHVHYGGAEFASPQDDFLCYATSSDGVTFTKQIDGNDNIVRGGAFTSVRWHPTHGWMAVAENLGTGPRFYAYTALEPTGPWTLIKTISAVGDITEGKDLIQRDDGRWIAYIKAGGSSDQRRITAQISTSTDPGGGYTSVGNILEGSGHEDQRYSISVDRWGDIYLGKVLYYDSTTGRTKLTLYVSRNGLDFTLVDSDWLTPEASGSGAFDDEFVFQGIRITEIGNTWWIYYAGSGVTHDTPRPKDMRIGRASIPKGRIGQVSGTGSITTTLLQPSSGQTFTINCDASGGGKIEIEVLGVDGLPLAGYAQAEAVDITSNTYAIEPTWAGALELPTGSPIKLRFHLTAATIYGYQIS